MATAPIHAFLKLFEPVLHTMFFTSHWLLSHITIVKIMNSSERGMNVVAINIIKSVKKTGQARGSTQRPPVLKSCALPTELWGSAKLLSDNNILGFVQTQNIYRRQVTSFSKLKLILCSTEIIVGKGENAPTVFSEDIFLMGGQTSLFSSKC